MRGRRVKQNPPKMLSGSRMLLAALVVAVTLLIFVVREVLTQGPDNFSIVFPHENGNLELVLYDLTDGKVISVDIPGEVQVNLAMKRGTLRAKSLKRLIDSENLPGQLIADSVMKTLRLPVDYWAEKKARGTYFGGDVPVAVRVAIFANNLKGLREERINLAASPYLIKTKLTDGEEGYLVSRNLTLSLVSLFADPAISSSQTAVRLVNQTGDSTYDLSGVAEVLEVLGAKPVPPLRGDTLDADCIVKANDGYVRARVAVIFNCQEDETPPETFDIELILGSRFAERF